MSYLRRIVMRMSVPDQPASLTPSPAIPGSEPEQFDQIIPITSGPAVAQTPASQTRSGPVRASSSADGPPTQGRGSKAQDADRIDLVATEPGGLIHPTSDQEPLTSAERIVEAAPPLDPTPPRPAEKHLVEPPSTAPELPGRRFERHDSADPPSALPNDVTPEEVLEASGAEASEGIEEVQVIRDRLVPTEPGATVAADPTPPTLPPPALLEVPQAEIRLSAPEKEVPPMPGATERPRLVIGRLHVEVLPDVQTAPPPSTRPRPAPAASRPRGEHPRRSSMSFGLGQM